MSSFNNEGASRHTVHAFREAVEKHPEFRDLPLSFQLKFSDTVLSHIDMPHSEKEQLNGQEWDQLTECIRHVVNMAANPQMLRTGLSISQKNAAVENRALRNYANVIYDLQR